MPKVVDHEQKRAELLVASCAVIADEGLSAATLRRVAERAGCTTGTVTHYFPNRQALLVGALRSSHYAAGARMLSVAQDAPDDLARLRAVALEALPLDDVRLTEWRVWLAFWAEAVGNRELAEENDRRYDEWHQALQLALTPFFSAKSAREREVLALMALIDGLGVRLVLRAGTGRALAEHQRAASDVLRAHLDGLSLRRTTGKRG